MGPAAAQMSWMRIGSYLQASALAVLRLGSGPGRPAAPMRRMASGRLAARTPVAVKRHAPPALAAALALLDAAKNPAFRMPSC